MSGRLSRLTNSQRVARSAASVSPVLAAGRDPLDPDVGAQRIQDQQQAFADHLAGCGLPGGGGGEGVAEGGDEVGFLEEVQQIDDAPPGRDLGVQRPQVLRRLQLAQVRDMPPRLTPVGLDPRAAGAVLRTRPSTRSCRMAMSCPASSGWRRIP